jgi:serine/threonine-protein kinase
MDRKTFLAKLRRSGLVTDGQLARVKRHLPATGRGRLVARKLVELGLLTKFQAEHLLAGRNAGFQLGQYRVLDQLGRGGMGRVYKAEHRTMARVVALKVLAPSLLQTARAQDLFLREARAVAQLVHPNIVTAFDANEAGGRYFLVLEYVDGPNLEQLVRRQGPLPADVACDYVRQIANGLQCAHNLGMVHRDIKPANLLVQTRGRAPGSPGLVKISDFGLARLNAPPTDGTTPDVSNSGTIVARENTVMGTPDYLSPEQSRNLHSVDIRSDLYSLGCTFYFLLTGQVPFPGGNTLDKLIRHSTEVPVPVSAFRQDVQEPVLAIVARLMAKEPQERFQTPAELADALQPYALSGPTPWAPYRPPSGANLDATATPAEDLATASGADFHFESFDELTGPAENVQFDPLLPPVIMLRPRPASRPGVLRRLLDLPVGAARTLFSFLGGPTGRGKSR